MDPKLRKIIFYGFAVIFLIAAAYLLVLAQGFIIDAKNLRFTKTGALFLKFVPSDAQLTINDKLYPPSKALINQSVFIKNLLPDSYEIIISKNGMREWHKKLRVEPGKVSAASEIRLWPETLATQKLMEKTDDFWLTNRGLIYESPSGTINFSDRELRGDKIFLAGTQSNLVITKKEQNYFLTDLNNHLGAININELFNSLKQRQLLLPGTVPIKDLLINPLGNAKILITTQTALYSLDTKKVQLEKIADFQKFALIDASNNEVFLADGRGNIMAVNLVLKTKTLLATGVVSIKSGKVNAAGTKIFLIAESGELFFFDRQSQKIEKISENAKDFYLSEEEKRLAILSDNKILLFYLADYEADIKETKGTYRQIPLPPHGQFLQFVWAPGLRNYFFVMAGDELMVSELDLREPHNFQILEREVKKYVLQKKELYILKGNGDLLKTQLDF